MGLVVSGVWLHIITPIQTAALIAGYGPAHAGLRHPEAAPRAELAGHLAACRLGTTIGIPIGGASC